MWMCVSVCVWMCACGCVCEQEGALHRDTREVMTRKAAGRTLPAAQGGQSGEEGGDIPWGCHPCRVCGDGLAVLLRGRILTRLSPGVHLSPLALGELGVGPGPPGGTWGSGATVLPRPEGGGRRSQLLLPEVV